MKIIERNTEGISWEESNRNFRRKVPVGVEVWATGISAKQAGPFWVYALDRHADRWAGQRSGYHHHRPAATTAYAKAAIAAAGRRRQHKMVADAGCGRETAVRCAPGCRSTGKLSFSHILIQVLRVLPAILNVFRSVFLWMLIRKIRAPVVQIGSTRHKKWRRFSFSMSDVSNHAPRNVGSRSWPNWSKKTDSSAPLLTTRKITFSAKSHFSQMCRTEQLLLLSTSLRIYRKKSWSSNGSLCLWYNFAWNRKNL